MTPCPGSRCMRPRSVSEEASESAPSSEDRIGRSASRSVLRAPVKTVTFKLHQSFVRGIFQVSHHQLHT